MKRSWQTIFFVCFTQLLLLSGCTPQFCSVHCAAPTQTPQVTEGTIDYFAKQGVTLMPKGDLIKIVLPSDTFFRNNSPQLKNDKKSVLTHLAQFIQGYGQTATIDIRGYTDTISSDEAGKKLSLARARAVLVYLWAQGLDADHLYALGYGANHLVGDPSDVSANAANRRVEIIIHAHCTTCF